MKKRWIGILLVAGLVSILGGCEKKEASDDTKAEATATPEAEEKESLETLDIEKYVKVGEYKGIALTEENISVSEEEIDAEIQERLSQNPLAVPEGIAEEGDLVNISYVGKMEGTAFEGGTAENQEVIIGSKMLIDGFEDGMIGMKTGETKVLNLTFPEDYNEELGGKAVEFTVTMNSVSRAPESLTAEWIAANSEVQTEEEYRQQVRGEMENMKNLQAEENKKMAAWQQVVTGSEVLEYPEFLLEEGKNMLKENLSGYAQMMGMELSEFLAAQEITEEDFEAQCEEFGKSIAAQKLVMQAIKKAEGMEDTDPEAQELLQQYAENAGMNAEQLLETYGEEEIYQSITLDRVCGLILEQAVLQPQNEQTAE